jgi:vancomycin resistance protein VanJ
MNDKAPRSTAPAPAPARSGGASRTRTLLLWLVAGYALSIVALWMWMVRDGDRGWLATLFVFGPRWICALPLPVLTVLAAIGRRQLLWPLAATAAIIVFPILGLEVHFAARAGDRHDLRVMTCNVDQDAFRPISLALRIEEEHADIVAVQEVRTAGRFDWPPGWYVVAHDEFMLASRFPIMERDHISRPTNAFELAGICYVVKLPNREIQVFNLHLETPRPGLEAVLSEKTGIDISQVPLLEEVVAMRAIESARAAKWIAQFPGPKIVLGDFNMPVESVIFRGDWSGMLDAFSTVGRGFGFTKISEVRGWTYGTRIDHVLFEAPLRCVRCWVVSDVGSDHLPLLADFNFK